jgi:biotin transport system substrate-specific component
MKIRVKDICLMATMLAVLIVCSKITIPTGLVPITLQTFAVVIIALILGFTKSTIVIVTYIVMGLIGIPVFSSGGGFDYIFKPSFGYILGFVFQAMIISLACKSEKRWLKYVLSIVGLLVDYAFGTIYFAMIEMYYLNTPKDILFILNVCVNYFYIFDIIKIVIACVIYSRVKNIIWASDDEYKESLVTNVNHKESI